MIDLARRMVAELIGTALLVIFGAGALVAALEVGKGTLGYAGLGIVGFSFALVIAGVVYAFGTTSGAHINPAVTIGLASARVFPWRDVPFYVFAQAVGALCGGLLIVAIFGQHAIHLNAAGGTLVGAGFHKSQAAVAEGLGTFLLLLLIMALAVDRRAPTGWAGLVIGLMVACEIMVIGPISGGSVNPARTFGPYAATSIFGGSPPWHYYWIYWAGPVVGGVLACWAYVFVAAPPRLWEPAGEPEAAVGNGGRPAPAPAAAEGGAPAEAGGTPTGPAPFGGGQGGGGQA
jgi:glycerol uptake facilitator protein